MTKTIRHALVAKGVTAVSVQAAARIAEPTWYHRMRHPDTWRLGELRRVAAALGVSLAELVDDDG